MKPTYVLQVQTGEEENIKELLEKSLHGYDVSFQIPRKAYYTFKNGESILEKKIIFPGYIFVQCTCIQDFELVSAGFRYRSRLRILGKGPQGYQPVSTEETDWIQLLSGEPSRACITEKGFTFLSGPLRGMEDHVVMIKSRKKNVCLKIPFRGEIKYIWVAVDFLSS